MWVRTLTSSFPTEQSHFGIFWKLPSMWNHLRPLCQWSKQCYASWVWFWKRCFCSHFAKNEFMFVATLRKDLVLGGGGFMSQLHLQTNCLEKIWKTKSGTHTSIIVHVFKSKGNPKKLTVFLYKANHWTNPKLCPCTAVFSQEGHLQSSLPYPAQQRGDIYNRDSKQTRENL